MSTSCHINMGGKARRRRHLKKSWIGLRTCYILLYLSLAVERNEVKRFSFRWHCVVVSSFNGGWSCKLAQVVQIHSRHIVKLTENINITLWQYWHYTNRRASKANLNWIELNGMKRHLTPEYQAIEYVHIQYVFCCENNIMREIYNIEILTEFCFPQRHLYNNFLI